MIAPSVRYLRRGDAPHGLTLVELLVTIMIIGILSSSVLFAMSVAQESARKSRTRAVIATLHSLVMERWESYLTRRYNVDINDEYASSGPKGAALSRVNVIRQMLKMDFPDQWRDVETMITKSGAIPHTSQTYLHLSYEFKRSQAKDYLANKFPSPATAAAERDKLLEQNEGAECLYQIIEYARGDSAAFQMMPSTYIGDTDGDSLPEYLDGWGRPISFIRWPTGFQSELQNGRPGTDTSNEAGWLDHDPFDPLRVQNSAYRYVPLIISPGPDGLLDLFILQIDYSYAPEAAGRWNPYFAKGERRPGESGYDVNENGTEDWHDDIHNHQLSAR